MFKGRLSALLNNPIYALGFAIEMAAAASSRQYSIFQNCGRGHAVSIPASAMWLWAIS
jgi:hypothetical protein